MLNSESLLGTEQLVKLGRGQIYAKNPGIAR